MKFLKGTKFYSVLTGNCPVCHNESMYAVKNPYRLLKVISMNERCSHCQTKYQMEPSFFFGAMYVSYGVGITIGLSAFLIAHYILKLDLIGNYIVIVITVLALYPFILRISRNIWINLFLSFDSEKSKFTPGQND